MELLPPEEICFRTFTLFSKMVPKDKPISNVFANFQNNLPYYSKQKISNMYKELKKDDFQSVMKRYHYNFPFSPDMIRKIDNRDKSQTIQNCLFLLCSWIKWNEMKDDIDKNDQNDFLPDFLSTLVIFCTNLSDTTLNNSIGNELQQLMISAFVLIVRILVKTKIDLNLISFLPPLSSLYINVMDLNDETFDVFSEFIRKLLNKQEESLSDKENIIDENKRIYLEENSLKIEEKQCIAEKIKKTQNEYDILIEEDKVNLSNIILSIKQIIENRSKLPEYFIDDLIKIFSEKRKHISNLFELTNEFNGFVQAYASSKFLKVSPLYEFIIDIIFTNVSKLHFIDFGIEIKKDEQACKKYEYSKNFFVYFDNMKFDIFDKANHHFPEKKKFNEIIPKDFIDSIQKIEKIFLNNSPLYFISSLVKRYIDYSTKEIYQESNNSIIEVTAITLYFIKRAKLLHIESKELLNNKYILEPSFTIYTPCKNFEKLNTLRNFLFKLILNEQSFFVERLLLNMIEYPNLLAESIQRLFFIKKEIIYEKLPTITNVLLETLIHFRVYNADDIIIQLRTSALSFLVDVIFKAENKSFIFQDKKKIKRFIILLTETSIRKHFLPYLTNALRTSQIKEIKDQELFIKYIKKLIMLVFNEDEKISIPILTDLLNSFNEALRLSKELYWLKQLIPIFCQKLLNQKNKFSEDVLMYLITFLACTSIDHTIIGSELILVESALMQLTQNHNKIKDKLIQIIAGQGLSVTLPNFIIRQPQLLCSYLRIFFNSDSFYESFDFISKLCSFSSENCIKCHEGGVDIFIIDTIDKWRVEQSSDIYLEKIKHILPIFVQIASVVSSVSVVQRYISLLCPIETKYLTPYHELIIDSFNSILMNSKTIPAASYPLLPDHSLEIKGIPLQSSPNGFSFSFWFYPTQNESDYKHNILILNDSQKHSFSISLYATNIHVQIESSKDTYYGDFDIHATLKTWVFVTVTYIQNDLDSNVIVYLNGNFIKSIKKFGLFPISSNIQCTVNSSFPDSVVSFNPPSIGVFILSTPLSLDESAQLYDFGPRPSLSSAKNIIFAYEPQDIGEHLVFRPLFDNECISIIYKNITTKKGNSFYDLLLNFCKLNILLPIYSLFDTPLKDGNYLPYFSFYSITLLNNLFALGEKPQIAFENINGFSIISYLINLSGQNSLNSNLYNQFLKLTDVIILPNLQFQLFDSILMNIDLWLKADVKYQIRILKNWSRILYPSFKQLFEKHRPFKWLLYVLYKYFPYKNNENNHLNILECRKSISEIIELMIQSNVTNNDFSELIGYILLDIEDEENVDILQKIELLQFLEKFLSNQREKLQNFPDFGRLFFLLHNLAKLQDETIVFYLIKCFIIANILKLNLPYHINVHLHMIMKSANNLHLSKNYFKELIKIMNEGAPQLLPFLSFNAVKCGRKYISWIIKKTNLKQNYFIKNKSPIYPITMLLFANGIEEIIAVVKFLLNAFYSNWHQLYDAIDIVFQALHFKDLEKIKSIVLSEMYKFEKIPPTAKSILVRITRQFLYFRSTNTTSNIENMFNNTDNPFIENENDYRINTENSNDENHYIGSQINNYSFGSSFSNSGSFDEKYLQPKTFDIKDLSLNQFNPDEDSNLQIQDSFNTQKENEGKEVHFNLDLFEKILLELSSKRNSFHFGIRLSENRWIDEDLAKAMINYIEKNKLFQYSDLIFITLSLLSRNDRDFVKEKKNLLGVASSFSHENAKQFFYKYFKKKNYNQLSSYNFVESFSLSIDNDLINTYSNYCLIVAENHSPSLTNENEYLFTLISSIRETVESNTQLTLQKEQNNMSKWDKLAKLLTIDRSPWCKLVKRDEFGYSRNNAFCSSFCPFKIKRKRKFDKHIKASLLRDNGDSNLTARQLVELQNLTPKESPLSMLFSGKRVSNEDKNIINLEGYQYLVCTIVSIKQPKKATIFFGKDKLIICTNEHVQVIQSKDIDYVLYRTFYHKWQGFEIFTKNHESIYLRFEGNKFRTIIPQISIMKDINPSHLQLYMFPKFFAEQKITEEWVYGKISNFEYLMYLNIFSGRSFNDASQYPIFPWILSDYTSEILDLNDSKSYRDLSIPIGATTKERLDELKEKFNELKECGIEPFLYSSGPVNPLSVYLWLIRLEPFTTQHIEIQGGRFDYASRLFRSFKDTFEFVTTNINDYRELIPEFFFEPEVLVNINSFDLGKTDEGCVGNVNLPPWAGNDEKAPYNFIHLHRKALESDYVSKNLHKWIDLIWGYKQKSMECNNLYKSEMYESIWDQKNSKSSKERLEIESIQSFVGQIPPMLFTQPHPQRYCDEGNNYKSTNSIIISNSFSAKFESCDLAISANSIRKNSSYGISILDSKGNLKTANLDFITIKNAKGNFDIVSSKTFKQNGNLILEKVIPIFKNADLTIKPIINGDNQISYVETNHTNLVICHNDTIKDTITSLLDIVTIAYVDDWLSIASKDAAVSVYKDGEYKYSISSFRDMIQCISLSSTFDSMICGTGDNSLLFCRLSKPNIFHTCELEGKPNLLEITKSMGYVVVQISKIVDAKIQSELQLFNINGKLINAKTYTSKITTMTSFKRNYDGLDFIVCANEDGNVFLFEAYYLDLGDPLNSEPFECKIIKLDVYYEDQVIIVFFENGEVAFVNIK